MVCVGPPGVVVEDKRRKGGEKARLLVRPKVTKDKRL